MSRLSDFFDRLFAKWFPEAETPEADADSTENAEHVPEEVVTANLPSLTDASTIAGYGPVNAWWKMSDATLTQILKRMQKRNVRLFVVEAMGNANEDVLGNASKMSAVKAKWLFVADQCRRHGIWFNSINFNDNAGDGAYQNGGVKLAARVKQARAFMDWQAAQGFEDCVIITPVAETQTSAGKGLEGYAAKVLAKYRLCYNGGSRPQANASWSKLFCYHNASLGDWPKSKRGFVLSDTGAAIRALSNGDLYGAGNPAAIKAWLAAGVKRGQKIVAYYAFQYAKYDEAAIDALEIPANDGTEHPPVVIVDDIDLSKAQWSKINGAKARTTEQITKLDFDGKTFRISTSAGTKAWKSNGDGLNQYACLAVYRGGKWLAAKFDWQRPSNSPRGVRNILDGYMGWKPKSGERVYYFQINLKCDERTNAVAKVWP